MNMAICGSEVFEQKSREEALFRGLAMTAASYSIVCIRHAYSVY